MKIGVKSYTKIMSHFIDGLYMLCNGVLLKGDRLSQITEQQEREQHLKVEHAQERGSTM
jgi:hypothetical protein